MKLLRNFSDFPFFIRWIVSLLLLAVSTSAFALDSSLPKLTFTPQWLPQAQFSGYYMALEKGFYEAAGIDVSIVHPSASIMATERLKEHQADIISLFLVTGLTECSQGTPLVNISQLSQNSGLLFIAKKSSHIEHLEDLDGRRIGIWKSGFDEVPKMLFKDNNYHVRWVPLLSSINMFLAGGVDAMTVMSYNEYDQIINSGLNPDELSVFPCSDYGYNIPEDGIYCLQDTLKNRRKDLEAFVRATHQGWEYAREHREETLKVVLSLMKDAHVATNYAHQAWMLDKVLELQDPGTKNVTLGQLSNADFSKTQRILLDGGYISHPLFYKDFHVNLMQEEE
jgi:NitT/TauT family transport system substrate-binding protein